MAEIADFGGQYKCAYSQCECQVTSFQTYCSDYCSDADTHAPSNGGLPNPSPQSRPRCVGRDSEAGGPTPCMMLKNYQSLMQGEFSLNFNVKTKTKSTFNLDIRASRDPLATGYSQKDAGEPSVLYPYAEFLCAIGLQNFRPQLNPLRYFTWARPVCISIAHAACRQDVPGLRSQGFEVAFEKVSQGMREVKSVVSLQQGTTANF